MNDLLDLLLLVALLGAAGLWLALSRARELATAEARRQCERHGLQLLDETVGMGALRLRRLGGRLRLERRYDFEVSIDGDDREAGRLWLAGGSLTALVLPTIEMRLETAPAARRVAARPATGGNVVPLRPRLRGRDDLP